MKSLALTILYGSYRIDRMGIRAVKYIEEQFKDRGHTITFIDAKEYNLPMLDRMYKEYPAGTAPEKMKAIAEILSSSDGYIIVTGEYNHGVQPGLKNLMDHFLEEYFYKPSAIVSYSLGIYGGTRAAIQWRSILGEMGTPSIPSMLGLSKIPEILNEEGKRIDGKASKSTKSFIEELEWYALALKNARENER